MHFLQNPIQLDCRHCVCKDCIGQKKSITCEFCGILTENNLSKRVESKVKIRELINNFSELFQETNERFKTCFDEYNCKIFSFSTYRAFFEYLRVYWHYNNFINSYD